MKKIILISLLLLISCTSCSKKRETVRLTQDLSDFQIVDEDDNTIEPTEEEKYAIRIKVTKRTFLI
jgi:hypothetical protein